MQYSGGSLLILINFYRVDYAPTASAHLSACLLYTSGLELGIFDMGWPSAAAVAYNTSVGAFIIPVCLGVNLLMLLTKTTRTVNIDLWNYWHFAFIGAIVYFASDSIFWGFFAAIICYIITCLLYTSCF